jgi:hypothetical protein
MMWSRTRSSLGGDATRTRGASHTHRPHRCSHTALTPLLLPLQVHCDTGAQAASLYAAIEAASKANQELTSSLKVRHTMQSDGDHDRPSVVEGDEEDDDDDGGEFKEADNDNFSKVD